MNDLGYSQCFMEFYKTFFSNLVLLRLKVLCAVFPTVCSLYTNGRPSESHSNSLSLLLITLLSFANNVSL